MRADPTSGLGSMYDPAGRTQATGRSQTCSCVTQRPLRATRNCRTKLPFGPPGDSEKSGWRPVPSYVAVRRPRDAIAAVGLSPSRATISVNSTITARSAPIRRITDIMRRPQRYGIRVKRVACGSANYRNPRLSLLFAPIPVVQEPNARTAGSSSERQCPCECDCVAAGGKLESACSSRRLTSCARCVTQ